MYFLSQQRRDAESILCLLDVFVDVNGYPCIFCPRRYWIVIIILANLVGEVNMLCMRLRHILKYCAFCWLPCRKYSYRNKDNTYGICSVDFHNCCWHFFSDTHCLYRGVT